MTITQSENPKEVRKIQGEGATKKSLARSMLKAASESEKPPKNAPYENECPSFLPSAVPLLPSNNRAPLPFSEPLTHPALLLFGRCQARSRSLVPILRSNLRLDRQNANFFFSSASAMATDGREDDREGGGAAWQERERERGGNVVVVVHKRQGRFDVLWDDGGRARVCVRP